MCVEYSARAWDVPAPSAEAKVVLLKLADLADADGCIWYRPFTSLAADCTLTVGAVERALSALRHAGLVAIHRGHFTLLLQACNGH